MHISRRLHEEEKINPFILFLFVFNDIVILTDGITLNVLHHFRYLHYTLKANY